MQIKVKAKEVVNGHFWHFEKVQRLDKSTGILHDFIEIRLASFHFKFLIQDLKRDLTCKTILFWWATAFVWP